MSKACRERELLEEDLEEVKRAKQSVDKAFREQNARLEAIEREMEFYRKQATQAISDRDGAVWENEQLKQSNAELQASVQEAQALRLETAEQRDLAEKKSDNLSRHIAQLEISAKEAAIVPILRKELKVTNEKLHRKEEELRIANEKSDELEADLSKAKQQYKKTVEDLNRQIGSLSNELDVSRKELDEVARQKVDLLVRLSEAESQKSSADKEIFRLRKRMENIQQTLDEVTQQKVKALIDLAAIQESMSDGDSKPGSSPGKRTAASNRSGYSTPASSPAVNGTLPQASPSWASSLFGGSPTRDKESQGRIPD